VQGPLNVPARLPRGNTHAPASALQSRLLGTCPDYLQFETGRADMLRNGTAALKQRGPSGRTFEPAFSGIGVVRSDGINREVSDPRVSGIRPIFVAALAAAMLPACTQSCDTLSSGQQFPVATDLFAHPMSIYWRDRLFSKKHDVLPGGSPVATNRRYFELPVQIHAFMR
jgi:hypothetical protein